MNMQDTNKMDPIDDIDQNDEISLLDIVDFFAVEWRRLFAAAIATTVIVVGGAFLFGDYKANALIINMNRSITDTSNKGPFDFVKWKYFQKALPDLAAELVQSGRINPDEEDAFRQMSQPKWWNKNVLPVLALSKDDSRALGNMSTDFRDAAGTAIHYLDVGGRGNTKEAAERNLAIHVDFIRSGSIYLALKGLVQDLETTAIKADADLRKKILAAEVEMKFLERKSQDLDLLRKRFPGNAAGAGALGQILDPKDAAAKYLPIDTQLIAVNADIFSQQESLERLRNTQVRYAAMSRFVNMALPALGETTKGLGLGDELLRIVGKLRKESRSGYLVWDQATTDLESRIQSIITTFDKGLQASAVPQTGRAFRLAMLGPLGFLGGGMVMLFFILFQRALGKREARLSGVVTSAETLYQN